MFNISDFIYDLNGTCDCLEMKLDEYREQDIEIPENIYDAIDNAIFNCEQCGWWFDICDQADDDTWRCASCADED